MFWFGLIALRKPGGFMKNATQVARLFVSQCGDKNKVTQDGAEKPFTAVTCLVRNSPSSSPHLK